MKLELRATPQEVMRAVAAARVLARSFSAPEAVVFDLCLAVEEFGSNVVNHAYAGDPERTFWITLAATPNSLWVEVRDGGTPFDPTKAAAGVGPSQNHELLPGGWGLVLARKRVDSLGYTRESGENVLRFRKQWGSHGDVPVASPQNPSHQLMPLVIKLRQEAGPPVAAIAELSGSLDTSTAPELERQLSPILAGQLKHLVFDLAHLAFISSAGLRVFEIARKALRQRGGEASFVHLQPQIREVFAIIEALPGFRVFQNTAELDEYLAARQRTHTEKP